MGKKTNKTAQVLKLLTKSSGDIENPIINENFKEEVIHTREVKDKNISSDKSAPKQKSKNVNETGINIVEELVQEWLPETIKRFNCSESDVYKAELTVQALNTIPPKYVYINSEKDYESLNNIKNMYRREVIRTLVHLAIDSKKNQNFHRIS